MTKEQQIAQFSERFAKSFGDGAVALILYGSGAGPEFNEKYSDLNMLCVLNDVGPRELALSEPLFRWWLDKGNPAPVLMSEAEVKGSTDCFPIEYQDMQERRRVLLGKDVIEGLTIDRSFYRAQVEYELRSKLLRLRQKAAGVLQDKTRLTHLMADSVSTFLVLARHALLLAGHAGSTSRRDTVSGCQTHFAVDPQPFETLIELREGKKKTPEVDSGTLFAQYLAGVQRLVDSVDALHK